MGLNLWDLLNHVYRGHVCVIWITNKMCATKQWCTLDFCLTGPKHEVGFYKRIQNFHVKLEAEFRFSLGFRGGTKISMHVLEVGPSPIRATIYVGMPML